MAVDVVSDEDSFRIPADNIGTSSAEDATLDAESICVRVTRQQNGGRRWADWSLSLTGDPQVGDDAPATRLEDRAA